MYHVQKYVLKVTRTGHKNNHGKDQFPNKTKNLKLKFSAMKFTRDQTDTNKCEEQNNIKNI